MLKIAGHARTKRKDQRGSWSFLKEKVFRFLWGIAKLYNVLGGYIYYNSIENEKSVHKLLTR